MKTSIAHSLALVACIALAQPAFAQPAPAAPSSGDEQLYSCKKSFGMVSVTLKPEAELKDLITWAMGFTCRNFLLDPRIVATGKKVTVMAPNKMTRVAAWDLFLASLSTIGLTVEDKGNVLRIIESASAKSATLPLHTKGVPANSDKIIRYLLAPSYLAAEMLRPTLDAMRSPAGSVTTVGNNILITDYASQVRDMLTLARTLDTPGATQHVYTIPIKNADAKALATKINETL